MQELHRKTLNYVEHNKKHEQIYQHTMFLDVSNKLQKMANAPKSTFR